MIKNHQILIDKSKYFMVSSIRHTRTLTLRGKTMFGIAIAAFIGLIMLIRQQPFEVIFQKTTKFLYYWYIVIAAVFSVLIGGVLILGAGAMGAVFAGPLGVLGGVVAGAGIALFFIALLVLASVLQIFGARLLSSAVSATETGYVWDKRRLITGAILLLLGVFGLPFLS